MAGLTLYSNGAAYFHLWRGLVFYCEAELDLGMPCEAAATHEGSTAHGVSNYCGPCRNQSYITENVLIAGHEGLILGDLG
jgi:hypothetical protein